MGVMRFPQIPTLYEAIIAHTGAVVNSEKQQNYNCAGRIK